MKTRRSSPGEKMMAVKETFSRSLLRAGVQPADGVSPDQFVICGHFVTPLTYIVVPFSCHRNTLILFLQTTYRLFSSSGFFQPLNLQHFYLIVFLIFLLLSKFNTLLCSYCFFLLCIGMVRYSARLFSIIDMPLIVLLR